LAFVAYFHILVSLKGIATMEGKECNDDGKKVDARLCFYVLMHLFA